MTSRATRVVQLVSTLRRAGPTSVVLNIVRHVDRGRFDPYVVTLSPEPADTMAGQFAEAAVPVRSLALSRLRGALKRAWRRDIQGVLGFPLDGRCIVHSHGIRSDVLSSLRLAGTPRLATAHNFPYDDYPLKYGAVQGRWMAWRHAVALRRLPLVVACSSTLAERLSGLGIRAETVRNGVDTARFRRASPGQRAQLRSRLGLSADACVAACVGTLSPRKRPLDVVHAAQAIDGADLTVVFAGSGPLEAAVREAARGDGRIRYAGELHDVSELLRASDVFVSASSAEGLPVAALEAVACGLRLVLSDIGPHRELLQVAPSAGELFESGNVGSLAQALRRAALSESEGPTEAEVHDAFGAEPMARRYEDVYARIVRELCG